MSTAESSSSFVLVVLLGSVRDDLAEVLIEKKIKVERMEVSTSSGVKFVEAYILLSTTLT